MKHWLGVALSLGGLLSAAEIQEAVIRTPEGPRHYLMALPSGPPRAGRPLVCLFHGHLGSAKNTLGQGKGHGSPLAAWLEVADREGLIIVALDGAKGVDGKAGWNDGRPGPSGNPTTDDVAFADAVIARVEREQGTDPARVYAMGMSNGGVFTFRFALEGRHPLAGLAAACASMPGDQAPPLTRRALSVLLIAGTEDPLMPYGGGQVHFHEQRRGAVLGVEATLAYWRQVLGATGTPEEVPFSKGRRERTRIVRFTWTGAQGQVQLLRVEGGGHCEPSRAHPLGLLYRSVCGAQNHDAESAEEAWRFFRDKRARP